MPGGTKENLRKIGLGLVIGLVVLIGLVLFLGGHLGGGSSITPLTPPNFEDSGLKPNLEVGEGEVIFRGPNAWFKTEWDEVTDTGTHYVFSGASVSSDSGTTWEVFPDTVKLNKTEWTMQ